MKISTEEVRQVAHLARLEMNQDEIDSLTSQLDQILSYVDKLNELDTSGVIPTTHSLSLQNAFREDTVRPSLEQDHALANAPEENGEAFVVPKII